MEDHTNRKVVGYSIAIWLVHFITKVLDFNEDIYSVWHDLDWCQYTAEKKGNVTSKDWNFLDAVKAPKNIYVLTIEEKSLGDLVTMELE